MALKKALVFYNGIPGQIQAADTLDVPGTSAGDVVVLTNNEAAPIVAGTPVYADGNDTVKKAKADASGTKDVIGLVKDASIVNAVAGSVQVNGVLSLTTAQWDAAFGTTGGLTRGTRYFLSSATAGLGSSTIPSTVGQYINQLGIAISTTELSLCQFTPYLL